MGGGEQPERSRRTVWLAVLKREEQTVGYVICGRRKCVCVCVLTFGRRVWLVTGWLSGPRHHGQATRPLLRHSSQKFMHSGRKIEITTTERKKKKKNACNVFSFSFFLLEAWTLGRLLSARCLGSPLIN